MNVKMNIKHKKARYRIRYSKMIENLTQVADMEPKSRYMHRLMDTVICHDFETALDGVIEDFKADNDNHESMHK